MTDVLFISHSREVGGAEVYLQNLLAHLRRSQHWRLRLVCRREAAVDALAIGAAQWADVIRLDAARSSDLMAMCRLVREADLVHLNLAFPSGKYQLAAALAAWTGGRPLVVTHHLALAVPRRWRMFMRWLGRTAVRHIAISEAARTFLIEQFDYPPSRVIAIHNGIDPAVYAPASRANPDSMACITVARLSPQKGLEDLVDAIAVITAELPEARLTVIGDGELRAELEQRVREAGLSGLVDLARALPHEEVARRLASADVFIHPSRYEGGPPLALMEAMASGLPAVATDTTGVRELITGAELGTVVPVGDARQLAAAVIAYLKDPHLRARTGSAARAAVQREFTIDASMRRTEAVLEAAAAKHG